MLVYVPYMPVPGGGVAEGVAPGVFFYIRVAIHIRIFFYAGVILLYLHITYYFFLFYKNIV